MEEIKNIDSVTCKEVYVILNKLGFLNKIPTQLLEYIYNNKSISHTFDFDENIPLIYQLYNKNTKNLLVYLYLKYINDSKEEKEFLLNKIKENELEYQKKIQEEFNPDNLFKNKQPQQQVQENVNSNEVAMVEYKESLIKRLIKKLKSIFRKK